MIRQLANNLTEYLLKKEIVEQDNFQVYVYGIEVLLSTLSNIFLALMTGIILGMLFETLTFLFAFAILRVYCGGYHAKTHLGCIFAFLVNYAVSMLTVYFTPIEWTRPLCLLIAVASFLYIYKFAPVQHKNRPLEENEYNKFKKTACFIAVFELAAIVIISVFLHKYIRAAMLISLAMLSVVLIMAIAKFKKSEVI
jgi:accessory gene regulator B